MATTTDTLLARFDKVVAAIQRIEQHIGFADVLTFAEDEVKVVETKAKSLLGKVEDFLHIPHAPAVDPETKAEPEAPAVAAVVAHNDAETVATGA